MTRPSVRLRLLAALAVLTVATLLVGAMSWRALDGANERLEILHSDTLAEVARALTLVQQTSDLATSAPYLLTLDAPFRIRLEGEKNLQLLDEIEKIQLAAKSESAADLLPLTVAMRSAISDLIAATQDRATLGDLGLRLTAELVSYERHFAAMSAMQTTDIARQQDWLVLQRLAAALLGAGRAENLISAGEFQREYLALATKLQSRKLAEITKALAQLDAIASGNDGLFELRRRELGQGVAAEAALFRIRQSIDAISALAAQVVADAQNLLAEERAGTSTSIATAKSSILLAGLSSAVVALATSVFVVGYVTGNLRAISTAMTRLANGDRDSRLPRGTGSGDEIGRLLYAFRVFRANAIRLDRSHQQRIRKNALFETVFSNMTDGVAVLSEAGHLVAMNPRLAAVLTLDPRHLEERTTFAEILHRAGFRSLSSSVSGFSEYQRSDGHTVELRTSSLPDGGQVQLFLDATERRQLDARLQQIQRIEVLSKVTGEVAHDFGNILSTISAGLHLIETAPAERVSALHQKIASAVELGTSLIQRLLAFARRQHLEPEVTDLNCLVEGMADLIGFAIPSTMKLQITLASEEVLVRVDPGQMESALLNLCLNASQASVGEGHIRLVVTCLSRDMAMIEVHDQGCGMSEFALQHAMEPFYSARRDGSGTGLGLSMVYGFIHQSGGDIKIMSCEGEGTTVQLFLPRQGPVIEAVACRSGRALVVEDDLIARSVAVSILEREGFKVIETDSFTKAQELLAGHGTFDLLVTDLHLSANQSGWELAELALTNWADLHAIILSGRLPAKNPLIDRFSARITTMVKPAAPEIIARALAGFWTQPR